MANLPVNWGLVQDLDNNDGFGEYSHPAIDQVDSPVVYRAANPSIALRWSHSGKLLSIVAAGRVW
jgi:hypothetical protein